MSTMTGIYKCLQGQYVYGLGRLLFLFFFYVQIDNPNEQFAQNVCHKALRPFQY